MKKFFITLSILTNILCLSFLWMMLKIGDQKYKIEESKEYYLKTLKCVKLESVVDSISYASQLGRLDTISLALAIFSIILGFAAIVGFLHIKETSEAIARDVSRETAENHLRRLDSNEEKNEIRSASEKKIRNKKAIKDWAEVNRAEAGKK